jgi:hypothetical protein
MTDETKDIEQLKADLKIAQDANEELADDLAKANEQIEVLKKNRPDDNQGYIDSLEADLAAAQHTINELRAKYSPLTALERAKYEATKKGKGFWIIQNFSHREPGDTESYRGKILDRADMKKLAKVKDEFLKKELIFEVK